MGGDVSAISVPGAGSTFTLRLPVATPAGPVGGTEPEPEPGPGRRVATAPTPRPDLRPVLVAEDNAVNQLLIEKMLAGRGYVATIVANGAEALNHLAGDAVFAAVFMDCQMPKVDGYAATMEIRAREHDGKRIPIIAMTANAMKGDRDRCLASGMDDYLSKPLRADQLDAVLERWVHPPDGPVGAHGRVELVDPKYMRMFREECGDVTQELIGVFEQGTPQILAELEDAVARADDAALRRSAHELKGSCQAIGATFMARLAEDVEHGDEEPAVGVQRLQTALGPTSEALARELTSAS